MVKLGVSRGTKALTELTTAYALMATMSDSIGRRVSWMDDGDMRFALDLSEPPSARAFFSVRERSFSRSLLVPELSRP